MTSKIDLTGRRFGRWTVLGETPRPKPEGTTRWHCRCDCGNEKQAVLYNMLTTGQSKSCGCLRRDRLRARWETQNSTLQ